MITSDDLRARPLFADVAPERLEHLAESAADLRLADGEYAVHEGETPGFYYVLEGGLDIMKRMGGTERVLLSRGIDEYFGEVPLMLGSPTFAGARARGNTRLMKLDGVAFRHLMADSATVATAVATSVAQRVTALSQLAADAPAAAATIIGKRGDPACHQMRDFLARNQVSFDWLEPGDALVAELLPGTELPPPHCPIVRLADGRTFTVPTIEEVAVAVGIAVKPQRECYDLVVIGGGPAGLAASVYGASEGLTTLMIEREAPGGQAGTSSRIENYLGFPAGLSGDDLATRALQQAQRLGAEIVVTRGVAAIETGERAHRVEIEGGDVLETRAIIIATGVRYRPFTAAGAERMTGRGLYYGAARTEAPLARGQDIVIIGGGNSAGQAAVFFSTYAASVTIAVRGESIAATMSAYLIDELKAIDNVRIEVQTEIVAVHGTDVLDAVTIRGPHGEERRPVGAVFVFIGADADTDWLPAAIARDDRGYVMTGSEVRELGWPLRRDPFLLETSVPAIFAAGDVRHGSVKRVAAGVGEGSMAVAFVHQALAPIADPQPAPR
jgi:thioredoxin reductase (NADPH)